MNRRRREAIAFANRRLTGLLRPLSFPVVTAFGPPALASDLRRFDFERATRPASSTVRAAARLTVVDRPRPRPVLLSRARTWSSVVPLQTRATVAFSDPGRVDVCVRRAVRREVMHAKGRVGAGARNRRPRRSLWSNISCR